MILPLGFHFLGSLFTFILIFSCLQILLLCTQPVWTDICFFGVLFVSFTVEFMKLCSRITPALAVVTLVWSLFCNLYTDVRNRKQFLKYPANVLSSLKEFIFSPHMFCVLDWHDLKSARLQRVSPPSLNFFLWGKKKGDPGSIMIHCNWGFFGKKSLWAHTSLLKRRVFLTYLLVQINFTAWLIPKTSVRYGNTPDSSTVLRFYSRKRI